ncbi:Stp1/IreP family PP2C-type Ser/Thr phosphatase [bacterium]|nr:Stp1/IreP family PP2C-type Ser/Thr phosphatase [bacterium]
MRIEYSAKTDLGRKRNLNEDNYSILANRNLFVVADGMGGHAAGEVASKIAVETMKEFITVANQDEEITWPFDINLDLPEEANQLETAIKLANNRIYQTALEQQKLEGMGTTIVSLFYNNGIAYIGHVGDSRAYLIRESRIKPLTFDHSWVNVQVMLGEISKDEARNHPMKNIITRALGTKENVEVDLQTERVRNGDIIILCSDGLSGLIEDEMMKEVILENENDLDQAAERLIQLANENGGDDNITLILVKFINDPDTASSNGRKEDEITAVIQKQDLDDTIDQPDHDTPEEKPKIIETLDDFVRQGQDDNHTPSSPVTNQ